MVISLTARQRRDEHALHDARRRHESGLVAVALQEARNPACTTQPAGQATLREQPLLSRCRGLFQELLQPQRRRHVAAEMRLAVVVVAQPVDLPGRDDDLARSRADQVLVVAMVEAHRAGEDRPALLLARVVVRRQRATWL